MPHTHTHTRTHTHRVHTVKTHSARACPARHCSLLHHYPMCGKHLPGASIASIANSRVGQQRTPDAPRSSQVETPFPPPPLTHPAHTHTHTHTHIHTHTHTHTPAHTHLRTHTHTLARTHTHTHSRAHTHTRSHTSSSVSPLGNPSFPHATDVPPPDAARQALLQNRVLGVQGVVTAPSPSSLTPLPSAPTHKTSAESAQGLCNMRRVRGECEPHPPPKPRPHPARIEEKPT